MRVACGAQAMFSATVPLLKHVMSFYSGDNMLGNGFYRNEPLSFVEVDSPSDIYSSAIPFTGEKVVSSGLVQNNDLIPSQPSQKSPVFVAKPINKQNAEAGLLGVHTRDKLWCDALQVGRFDLLQGENAKLKQEQVNAQKEFKQKLEEKVLLQQTELQKKLEEIQTTHAEKLKELKLEHGRKLETLQADFNKNKAQQLEEQEKSKNELQTTNATKIKELETAHAEQVNAVQVNLDNNALNDVNCQLTSARNQEIVLGVALLAVVAAAADHIWGYQLCARGSAWVGRKCSGLFVERNKAGTLKAAEHKGTGVVPGTVPMIRKAIKKRLATGQLVVFLKKTQPCF